MKELSNNRQIAKNTLYLYARMFLTMAIGLYTSRIVLNVLGISDYGIYNVVGGIVNMMAFLNIGMVGASQRFMSFALGGKKTNGIGTVFCTSVTIHIAIAFIIFIIAETLGVWFLNSHMVIPNDRMYAANWVLQCSILTFLVSVISVPYNSLIIAHERMNIYAYVSILEVAFKLIVVFLLLFSSYDNLILYSTLILAVQILIQVIYSFYCNRNFSESHYNFSFDKELFKQMFSFAGWGMIGNMGFTFKDQGNNVILNLFFGTSINAARGVATQVSGIINGFASNFTMAINPQITKKYASGDINGSIKLVYIGARFTFYLLAIIVIPFLINAKYILQLWLGIVPRYTEMFIYFILIGSMIYSLTHTVSTAILATGNAKVFQLSLATILLCELPAAYIILLLGGKPYHAMIPSIFTISATVILRIILLKKYIKEYQIKKYIIGVIARCIMVFVICFLISLYVRSLLPNNLLTVIFSSFLSILTTCFTIIVFGVNHTERAVIYEKIKKMSNMKIFNR